MKYLITLFLLISSALNAMDQTPSAPKPKPIKIYVQPISGHARADMNQQTVDGAVIHSVKMASPYSTIQPQGERKANSYSYFGTRLTLSEIIPNDATKQLTVLFSLKPHKDKPAYQGAVITQYGFAPIPLGDHESDVHYFLSSPACRDSAPSPCDCPTQEEHQNDLFAWALFPQPAESNDDADELALALPQQSVESNTKKLRLTDDETVSEGKE